MGVLPQQRHNTKPLSFQFQDQDSSSTQSTGQSYPEDGSAQSGQISIRCSSSSARSKCVDSGGGLIRSSLGSQSFCFPPFQVDHNQSIAHIAFRHAEPYFDGVLAAYGPQSKIHQAQLMGLTSVRVPLPFDLTEEPIYVNAKQYHAILRRRQYRAKLEAQNKLTKARKPYLHESRHLHALRRARGSGGRFLNSKQLQEASLKTDSLGLKVSEGTRLNLGGNMSESKNHADVGNYRDGACPTGSDITSASNSDGMFQQHESSFRLSSYPPHIGWSMHGYSAEPGARGSGGGNQQHVSVLM
ncbi:nuclear transcription factor Y subunit A-3 [Neltuma alba]|uniref:nuclear transcription factor Y subunit A-3 n=1 Tax=Neltuma alba TaxID=207710 RepID=UPI0010A2EA8E|nr:nuclear transcription factor Y subunit A-3-like [Prosopis alba]XP_028763165.1 nuclear transcription factor Y subunit A-3-like [Prosopis alba]XP_028763166.1 nuclear transcription factor Y subunit A-3-like [Prosopis alba]XP_028763167.1 nuclear transcription factor Y subunit A-3-like [Prosopis alba]XP_028763168.1 nuclear transcription factor Y subunit A-3-like [Prosopis alba]XP_028763169.1 nuclear transcription factor Y subunit A-3-like [Prosopis alba]XP_028763170.1 nuclear transcription fact